MESLFSNGNSITVYAVEAQTGYSCLNADRKNKLRLDFTMCTSPYSSTIWEKIEMVNERLEWLFWLIIIWLIYNDYFFTNFGAKVTIKVH